MNVLDIGRLLLDLHMLFVGTSGSGKSMTAVSVADRLAADPGRGFTFCCPHGTARLVADRLANPARLCCHTVHLLDPASDLTFGINPFQIDNPHDWLQCHRAALMWTSSIASLYATSMRDTPQLEKNLYVLGMFAAYHGLTLGELLIALSLAGEAVREFMLTALGNSPVSAELEDLHYLAAKRPIEFFAQVNSVKNRMIRWLGSKAIARIFGRTTGNLDIRAIMDRREIVCIDASSLPPDDADFFGTMLIDRYVIAAFGRTPNASAPHHLIIDEAARLVGPATSSLLSQSRKYGLYGIFLLQGLHQARAKGEDVLQELVVNTGVKLIFRMPDPRDARYLAELCHTGHLDLQEWKRNALTPTAVGNDKLILNNRSRARHHLEHAARSTTDMRSEGDMAASTRGIAAGWGSASVDRAMVGVSGPPSSAPFGAPTPTIEQHSHAHQRAHSFNLGLSAARVHGRHVERGHAATRSEGSGHGTAEAEGAAEAIRTVYEDRPSHLFTLEEQLHKAQGAIMNLGNREVLLKLPGQAPIFAQTPDLPPAFASPEYERLVLPRFKRLLRESPYLMPAAAVDAEIEARLAAITKPQLAAEPDFTAAQAMPHIADGASEYADAFWRQHDPAQWQPSGEPPLRIIKGGKDDVDKSRG